jgi:hypothetical protein
MDSSVVWRVACEVASLGVLCTACAARPGPAPAVAERSCSGSFTVHDGRDLAAIEACERIDGDLRIANTGLESLEGLSSLRHVEGRLEITHNPRLRSLAGLDNLATVRTLVVAGNPALESVAALGQLAVVGSVTLSDEPQLDSLAGLEGVRFASRVVVKNTGIASFAPLHELHAVGDLVITGNLRLVSLGGLEGLEGARGIRIEGNPALGDVRALRRMTWLSSNPVVVENPRLADRDVACLQGPNQ